MKNIHVLPTDKPSRLSKDENDRIWLSINFEYGINDNNKQNIYITSDEEIKIGDYFCQSFDSIIHKCYKLTDNYVIAEKPSDYPKKICKKIILTTDTDLIKDGVQAIDDEFLEWFVKNPSCEEVEVIKTFEDYTIVGGKSDEIYYKIIIPKEEQKQHLIDMMKADEELGLYEEPKQKDIKQTAVEWLINELDLSNDGLTVRIINKAKEMEKQQIIEAYKEGMGNVDGWIVDENGLRQYYNETFKKE